MKKKLVPVTRVKNLEPKNYDDNWVIWAAWADRITFEEIYKKTGKTEKEVIIHMRKSLRSGSFKLWRKRVNKQSIKHLKLFKEKRKQMKLKINDF